MVEGGISTELREMSLVAQLPALPPLYCLRSNHLDCPPLPLCVQFTLYGQQETPMRIASAAMALAQPQIMTRAANVSKRMTSFANCNKGGVL